MSPSTATDSNPGLDAVQEHPEQLPSDETPESPYGLNNIHLPEQLIKALKDTAQGFSQKEMYVRRQEVMHDRLLRFYERGYQHVYAGRAGNYTQGAPGQWVQVDGREFLCPNYIDDYNIFTRYLDINCSILTQNSPGINFRPIDPSQSEDQEAAEAGEIYRKMFDRSNDVKSLQKQIARLMGVSGRVILWTRTEANAQKFGLNDDGTPKKMETTTTYGTLESRVPILSKSLADCMYCVLYDDPDERQAKSEYPEFKDKIKPNQQGLTENAYERTARMGVLQGVRNQAQIGDAFTHLCTREHVWYRPACFECEEYDDEPFNPGRDEDGNDLPAEFAEDDETPLSVKGKINQLFPFGVHAVFVGQEYVGCWAECIDDALCCGFPREGDGMYRWAMMDPMVVVQDRFNDNMNAAAEVWDMGWPSTWINAEDQEFDAIQEQKADPYAIRQKKQTRAGMKLQDEFFREPNPDLPGTFMQFLELLEGPLAQFMLAAPPALFGAAMEDQKTAAGYAQARSQALGQQAMTFSVIQSMMACMYYQAAMCATTNPDHSQEIVLPSDEGGQQTLRMERLTKGKFGAYPDEDTGFPESTVQKRGTLERILTMAEANPVIGQQIMSSPDNWKVFATDYGYAELKIPEAASRDKQQFEIEELLKGAPIPPDPQMVQEAEVEHAAQAIQAQHSGMPQPPFDPQQLIQSMTEPSVPVEELDYHQWEFEKCKEWLSSCDRRKQDADGNQQGVQNVILHAMQHQKFMMQEAMAQQAMMPPAAAPPAGKKQPPPLSSPPQQSASPPPAAAPAM